MKALTNLPTQSYLRVAERANISLADLLRLVPALESGLLPAYIAHYRPDVSAGLDADNLHDVSRHLQSCLDLEDRRITVLATLTQKNQLTSELKANIEKTTERQTLEDLYRPFRTKKPSAVNQAFKQGLGTLADFLWDQNPPDADIETVALAHVNPEEDVPDARTALLGARRIVAQRLAEDPEIWSGLRTICFEHAELRIFDGKSNRSSTSLRKKLEWIRNYRSRVVEIGWQQHLALRCGLREQLLLSELRLPENRAISFILERLLRDRSSLFCSHLGAAAYTAYHDHLAPPLQNDVANWLTDRVDTEALRVFKRNLRRTLFTPPAGALPTIGLETSKPGGWRAAVVDTNGDILAAAIVYKDKETIREYPVDDNVESRVEETPASREKNGSTEQKKTDQKDTLLAGQIDHSTTTSEVASNAESVGDQAASLLVNTTSKQEHEKLNLPSSKSVVSDSESSRQTDSPIGVTCEKAAAEKISSKDDPVCGDNRNENESMQSDAGSPTGSVDNLDTKIGVQPELRYSPEIQHSSLGDLVKKYNIRALVVTKGPNNRETEKIIRKKLRQAGTPNLIRTTVKETGAWIYAKSRSARKELPNVEPSVRSALSLARRFQDPLAELVKIDPKLLGIGQFCSEIEPNKLGRSLSETVEACVREVGVDLNRASQELLGKLPGVTKHLAKRIIEYREKEGGICSRSELKKVPGMRDQLYRQLVGFVRIYKEEQPLDATGVHPDWYSITNKIVEAAGISVEEAIGKPNALASVDLKEFETAQYPRPILDAIVHELTNSKVDPRAEFKSQQPKIVLLPVDTLKAGLEIEGLTTSVTHFGVFIDIGADKEGLVHLSQVAEQFQKNGQVTIKPGDKLKVRVLSVEDNGDRISLTTLARSATVNRLADGRFQPKNSSRRVGVGNDRRRHKSKRRSEGQQLFGPDRGSEHKRESQLKKLSLEEKFSLLKTKYRTKV